MSTPLQKNKPLRIAFMGTPRFAVESLKGILDAGFEVVGVVTAPDRPAGRGRKIQEPVVKKFALEKNLPVLQPKNLKDPIFIDELRAMGADLIVVVAFRMLPEVVWKMPRYGTFNLHASLLPEYRGAAPINWAIINGETETGVTTFFIDEKIDNGNIILQEAETIFSDDSAGSLHDRLMHKGAKLVVDTCQLVSRGNVPAKKQKNLTNGKLASKIHKETCRIDWGLSLNKIHDHVRGLSPRPGAWTLLMDKEEELVLKIFRTKKEFDEHTHAMGSVFVTKRALKVAVTGGYLELLEIQLPGRRRMKAVEVLQGLDLEKPFYVR